MCSSVGLGAGLPGLSERSDRPVHDHVEGGELHLEQLGAVLAAAILEEPKPQESRIPRLDLPEAGLDLLPKVSPEHPAVEGLRVGASRRFKMLQIRPAQPLTPPRGPQQIASLVLRQSFEPRPDAGLGPGETLEVAVGRDKCLAQAVLGVGLMREHGDEHLRVDAGRVVPIQGLERPPISGPRPRHEVCLVIESLGSGHA